MESIEQQIREERVNIVKKSEVALTNYAINHQSTLFVIDNAFLGDQIYRVDQPAFLVDTCNVPIMGIGMPVNTDRIFGPLEAKQTKTRKFDVTDLMPRSRSILMHSDHGITSLVHYWGRNIATLLVANEVVITHLLSLEIVKEADDKYMLSVRGIFEEI